MDIEPVKAQGVSLMDVRAQLQSPRFLKGAAIALGVFILIGGVVAFMNASATKKEVSLQGEYFRLETQVLKVEQELKSKSEPLTEAAFGNTLTELQNFVSTNPKSLAGVMGGILLSDIFQKVGKPDLAIEHLTQVNAKGELGSLAEYRKASLMLDQGQHAEVVETADAILNQKTAEILHPEVRILKALALEQLGRIQEARDELQIVSSSAASEQSPAANRAKKYLRSLPSESSL